MRDELKEKMSNYSPSELRSLIDLTLLDETASDEALSALCMKATLNQVAAICVLPKHLKKIPPLSGIKLATVVNFPEGLQATEPLLTTIDELISNYKIDEIDYVFPYQAYLEGNKHSALLQCEKAYRLCQQQAISFKVILETGALPSLEFIYQLSTEVIAKGCDFLKTSTGKIAQGATPSSAFAILKAIKDTNASCGLKVSGGIKKPEQAFSYMALAQHLLERDLNKSWFRIGASSLLDELVVT